MKKCPFAHLHGLEKLFTLAQNIGDNFGDTEVYSCGSCGYTQPTEEAKNRMWWLGK